MAEYKNENITRRRFVKNVTGAAFCCACFTSLVLAGPSKPSEQNKGKTKTADYHRAVENIIPTTLIPLKMRNEKCIQYRNISCVCTETALSPIFHESI